MNSSLQKFKDDFLEHALSFLWRQWSQLGVLGYAKFKDRWIIDPEALLLFSLPICRYDARLFDEVADWLKTNGHFINVQRITAILKEYPFSSQASLSAIAEYLSKNNKYKLKWKNLIGIPEIAGNENFFLKKDGNSLPVTSKPDSTFLKRGLIREQLLFSGKAQVFPAYGVPSMMLRMRALFGINARSELLCLLMSLPKIHPAEAARLTGYYQKTVQTALLEMVQSGSISVSKQKKEKYYQITDTTKTGILGTEGENSTVQWVDWMGVFYCLEQIWTIVNRLPDDVSDLALLSEIVKLYNRIEHLFQKDYCPLKVNHPALNRNSGTAQAFFDDVLRSLQALNTEVHLNQKPRLFDFTGWVRRIDLHLRAQYPLLKTRIFEVSENNYQIYISNNYLAFDELQDKFDNSIRFMTAPVSLSENIPTNYLDELSPISDREISLNYEGVPFTINDILNHIGSIFPNLGVFNFKTDHSNKKFILTTKKKLSIGEESDVKEKLLKVKMIFPIEIKHDQTLSTSNPPNVQVDPFFIPAAKKLDHLGLDFLRRDEELWFDNIDNIYSGSFTKKELSFCSNSKSSCLVDLSVFKNINLRNHLLLYDVIYLVLPIEDRIINFYLEQDIKKSELLELIERERVKIVLTQPPHRHDVKLLKEIQERNSGAIISRRAVAALCIMDLVEINQNYILNKGRLTDYLIPFARQISDALKMDFRFVLKLLTWPTFALRNSFNALQRGGTKLSNQFGINNIVPIDIFSQEDRQALDFEFTVHAEKIHLAHAFSATYFPFITDEKYTDHPYTSLMGSLLNFYKYATSETIQEYTENVFVPQSRNPTKELITTFKVNEYISIDEFDSQITPVIRNGMNGLFTELENLTEKERKEKILQYNDKLDKVAKKNKWIKNSLDLGVSSMGLAYVPVSIISLVVQALGIASPVILKKTPGLSRIFDIVKESTQSHLSTEKKRISYLSQMNRVAKLREN